MPTRKMVKTKLHVPCLNNICMIVYEYLSACAFMFVALFEANMKVLHLHITLTHIKPGVLFVGHGQTE